MDEFKNGTCLSCLGTGEVTSERGPRSCPDCNGTGRIGDVFRSNEQRLREVEHKAESFIGEGKVDAKWLISELRRSRDALLKVMTAAQDGAADNELLRRIQFLANDVLGVYAVSSGDDSGDD